MIAMVASVSALANSHHEESPIHHYDHECSTDIHMEGKHCRGTIGCNCPGFRPITSGEVWQQVYCYHYGHKRGLHR